jgi:hypothetical protein
VVPLGATSRIRLLTRDSRPAPCSTRFF